MGKDGEAERKGSVRGRGKGSEEKNNDGIIIHVGVREEKSMSEHGGGRRKLKDNSIEQQERFKYHDHFYQQQRPQPRFKDQQQR